MACVRKRREKWVLDFRDQTGKRVWETTVGTRKAAETLLASRLSEIGRGTYAPSREQATFGEVAEAFREAHIKVNVRETTRKDYEGRLSLHILPHFSGWKLPAITPDAVEAFRARLSENGIGRRTVNKCLILMGSIFRYAIGKRWATYNPAASVNKMKGGTEATDGSVDDNILRPEEIQGLLLALDGTEQERWRVLILTAILTGLRQGELLGLQWGDIDWNARQVHVRRNFTAGRFYEPKTKSSRRRVDLPEHLVAELKKWRLRSPKGELDLVFPTGAGNPENHGNVLRRGFYPALRRAKLRKIRFHDLRHTYASLLIANGEHPKYIQAQMGHSSINVTMDVYGHLMNATNSRAAEKLASLALGGSSGSKGSKKALGENSARPKSGSKTVAIQSEEERPVVASL